MHDTVCNQVSFCNQVSTRKLLIGVYEQLPGDGLSINPARNEGVLAVTQGAHPLGGERIVQ